GWVSRAGQTQGQSCASPSKGHRTTPVSLHFAHRIVLPSKNSQTKTQDHTSRRRRRRPSRERSPRTAFASADRPPEHSPSVTVVPPGFAPGLSGNEPTSVTATSTAGSRLARLTQTMSY